MDTVDVMEGQAAMQKTEEAREALRARIRELLQRMRELGPDLTFEQRMSLMREYQQAKDALKGNIGLRVRRQVWHDQEGHCWWCGWPMEPPMALRPTETATWLVCCMCASCRDNRSRGRTGRSGDSATCLGAHLDHLQPVALDGGNERDNLVYACTACNQRRNVADVEFIRLNDEVRRQAGRQPLTPEERARSLRHWKRPQLLRPGRWWDAEGIVCRIPDSTSSAADGSPAD